MSAPAQRPLQRARTTSALERFLHSSIGRKALVALSGLCLVGFLIVHLAGNLTLFADATGETFNSYAHAIESNPVLPIAELLLLALFLVHIALAVRLSLANRDAREHGYEVRASLGRRSLASGSMLVTGLLVLVFLIVHLSDFRIPKLFAAATVSDLARAVKTRMASPAGALIYFVGVAALGLHLSHALSSAAQTLGIHHPRYSSWISRAAIVLALVLFVGFAAFPLYYFFQGGAR